ncbi:hypothetical protein [Fulvitalea axinellae]
MKKVAVILVLALPLAMIVFFRVFAEDQFRVPELEGNLSEQLSKDIKFTSLGKVTVAVRMTTEQRSVTVAEEMDRIMDMLGGLPKFSIVWELSDKSKSEELEALFRLNPMLKERVRWVGKGEVFGTDASSLMSSSDVLVLDWTGKPRGAYDSSDSEEMDRLVTELHVLDTEFTQTARDH